MDKRDLKNLLEKAVTPGPQTWADFGSGEGAFTLVLRELGGKETVIFSVDKDQRSLHKQEKAFENEFPGSTIQFLHADFTAAPTLPLLDGILMANSLHFIKEQKDFLENIKSALKPHGKLVIVEYDTDSGGPFVPYPLSFKTLQNLCASSGLPTPALLSMAPSRYHGSMYSAEVIL